MTGAGSERRAPGGLEAVYLANRDALMRFLRARGAGDSAEDLVQQLWLKVSAAPSTPVAEPLAYLYRAANNLMISSYRSAVRRGSRERDCDSSGTGELAVAAEEIVSTRQHIDAAERRLRELGPRILRVFVLFRVDGIPQRQIAEQLHVSLSAVEKDLQRAYRAIADLRRELDAG